MPPQDPSNLSYHHYEHSTADCRDDNGFAVSLIELAARELDEMRQPPPPPPQPSRHHFLYSNNSNSCCDRTKSSKALQHHAVKHCSFPPACYQLLQSIKGNNHCIDCGDYNPQWASVTYGTLVCLKCSGRHRSMGVGTSFIRSIHMDSWSPSQVLSMLEGGNAQLSSFFDRHALSQHTCRPFLQKINEEQEILESIRYKTKAALFYRNMLAKHVKQVEENGTYKGREEARRRAVLLQQRSDDVSNLKNEAMARQKMYRRCTSSPPSAA